MGELTCQKLVLHDGNGDGIFQPGDPGDVAYDIHGNELTASQVSQIFQDCGVFQVSLDSTQALQKAQRAFLGPGFVRTTPSQVTTGSRLPRTVGVLGVLALTGYFFADWLTDTDDEMEGELWDPAKRTFVIYASGDPVTEPVVDDEADPAILDELEEDEGTDYPEDDGVVFFDPSSLAYEAYGLIGDFRFLEWDLANTEISPEEAKTRLQYFLERAVELELALEDDEQTARRLAQVEATAHDWLGKIYANEKEMDLAKIHYREAALAWKAARLHVKAADSFEEAGMHEEAAAEYVKVADQALGLEKGKYLDLAARLLRGSESDRSAELQLQAAEIYWNLERKHEATLLLTQASEAFAELGEMDACHLVAIQLAEYHQELGRWDRAVHVLKTLSANHQEQGNESEVIALMTYIAELSMQLNPIDDMREFEN